MEAIEEVKKMILNQYNGKGSYNKFDGFNKVYYQSNEYIEGYLKNFQFSNNDKALSIAGSGDHAFSLIYHSINNIQLFDINKLTEYFILGLKRAMILKYDYYEYININKKLIDSNISLEEQSEILLGLLPFMEKEYKIFWQNIIDFNYKLQKPFENSVKYKNLFEFFYINYYLDGNILQPIYLQNEKNYDFVRKSLYQVNFNFKYANVIDSPNVFQEKYDILLLSNTLDYVANKYKGGKTWQITKLLEYLKELEKISNNNALIFLSMFEASMIDNLVSYLNNYINSINNDLEIIDILTNYYSIAKVLLKRVKK